VRTGAELVSWTDCQPIRAGDFRLLLADSVCLVRDKWMPCAARNRYSLEEGTFAKSHNTREFGMI